MSKKIAKRSRRRREPLGIRGVLALASNVIEKLPNKNDSIWTSAIKGLAMVDSLRELFFPVDDRLNVLIRHLGLKDMYNPLVVKVVTSTALAGKLETRETRLSDNRSLIEKWRLGRHA
jgi:hypothetical protein